MKIIRTEKSTEQKKAPFISHILKDHLFESAATLSYYFLFSVFPLAIFVSAAFSTLHISPESLTYLFRIIPEQIVSLFQTYLQEISLGNTPGLITIGILLTLYSMSKALQTMKRKFRIAYQISPKNPWIKEWIITLVFVFLILLSFYATLILLVAGNSIIRWLEATLPQIEGLRPLLQFLRYPAVAAYLAFVLLGIYYLLPGIKQRILHILPGTLFSLSGWIIMSWLFSFYFSHFATYATLYGSLGTIIALLTWLFLVNTILLLGAYINSYFYLKQSEKNQ